LRALASPRPVADEPPRFSPLLPPARSAAKNTKAVLWLPGRADAFFHPHVGRAFDAAGYDVYVLHYHHVGVCRRQGLFTNPYLTSHILSGSMDEYVGEIEHALAQVKLFKAYASVLGYAHSTGAPILCNYLLRKGDAAFDGFVFNSPFFDWGAVGGEVVEQVLERTVPWLARVGLQRYTDPFGPFKPDSPNAYAAKIRADYEFDPRDRPLFGTPTTVGFIVGVDKIQTELQALSKPLTSKPLLLLTSKSDSVLMWDEIVTIVKKVAAETATEVKVFNANAHDVFISPDKVDTDAALTALSKWLATKSPGMSGSTMLSVPKTKCCGF
jgi:alpha-beta hydrolase superfamily lysophospholipase